MIINLIIVVLAVFAALAAFTFYTARQITKRFPPEGRFIDLVTAKL